MSSFVGRIETIDRVDLRARVEGLVRDVRLRKRAEVEAGARARFRAATITSFDFIAGLIPLVVAQGAATLRRGCLAPAAAS